MTTLCNSIEKSYHEEGIQHYERRRRKNESLDSKSKNGKGFTPSSKSNINFLTKHNTRYLLLYDKFLSLRLKYLVRSEGPSPNDFLCDVPQLNKLKITFSKKNY